MTIHRNEILPFLLDDPFDGYQEEYDKGIFQFQSNEVELTCHRSIFNTINYGDRIVLSKNGIYIKGIVTGKKPDLMNKTGMIRVQDGNIQVKNEIIRHRYTESTYLKPISKWPGFIEHLRAINNENSIFQSLDISFGSCPVRDERTIHYLLSYKISKVWDLNPRLYQYGDRIFLRLNFYGNLVIEYNSSSTEINVYWRSDFPSWYKRISTEDKETESSRWIRYYNRATISALIPAGYTVLDTLEFYDVENGKYFRFDQCSGVPDDILFVRAISNYNKIPLEKVYLYSSQQEFLNIIADMCFLTNSYFFVRDFDTLVVRPHNTGDNTVDITKFHNLIISASHEIEEYEYEEYSLKSAAYISDMNNAFGLSQSYVDSINETYKKDYSNISKIKIRALRKGQNNPFSYIRINDEVIDNGKSLGIVRNIDPSSDGKIIEFTLHKYISDENINDWWSL